MPDAKKTMLAAVPAIDERLIGPLHFMQIFSHLPFSYMKILLFALLPYTGYISEWIWFALSLFAHKANKNNTLFVTGQFQWQHRLT